MTDHSVNTTVDAILEHAFQSESVVVCVGPQLSHSAGIPDWRRFLDSELQLSATSVEALRSAVASGKALQSALATSNAAPTSAHVALAALGPRAVVTTNYDDLIEQALAGEGREPAVVTRKHGAPPLAESSVPVFKIYGSIDDLDTLIFAQEEVAGWRQETTGEGWLLRTMLAVSLVLVVGYELDSPELAQIYEKFSSSSVSRNWFVLVTDGDPVAQALWHSRGVRILRVVMEDLAGVLEELQRRREADRKDRVAWRGRNVFVARGRNVFIASSAHKRLSGDVRQFLESRGLATFALRDTFHPGQTVSEALEQAVESSAAAIVIFGDDELELAVASPAMTRGNLLFELGFLVGRLGRERVLILVPRGAELPFDLPGVQYLAVDPARFSEVESYLERWAAEASLPAHGE